MDAQRAAAAFGQHVEIAACLGGLDHAEASLLAGHRQIDPIVRGDLHEYAAVGPALVSRTGGMHETRAEFASGRDTAPASHLTAHVLQPADTPAIPFAL